MNWEAIGAVGEILGAIGVIATLAYLAVQIRQNTQMVKAQTRDSITNKQLDYYSSIYENDGSSESYFAAVSKEFDISDQAVVDELFQDKEFQRFALIVLGNFRLWENEWYQYQQGLFETEEFLPRQVNWSKNMSIPAYKLAWSFYRDEFSPSFRQVIDELVN